ncbi:MAG: hypothetical protein DIU76_06700 [Bacillota bacterium]|nr:MAG: hypothetical protein DIU76_06700 [Bacillota bacterium]
MMAQTTGSWPVEGIRRVEIHGGRLAVRVRPGHPLAWDGPATLVARREGDGLVLRTPHPRRWAGWIGPAEPLTLTLPPAVEVLVVRCTGDLDLRDLDVEADLHLRAGDLRASGCRGRWRIRTGAGDVTLMAQRGELDVQTGAGEVTVRGGRLDRLRIRTGAGDVHLDAEIAVQAEVTTGAGSVDLRPRNQGSARVQARSGFGDVILDLTGVRGGRVELQTGAGTIHLPGGIHVGRRGGLGQRVVDALGPGDGAIEVTTGAGTIRVVGYGAQPWGQGSVAQHPSPAATPGGSDWAVEGGGGPAGESRGEGDGGDGGPGAPQGEDAGTGRPAGSMVAPYRHPRQVLEALARGELTVQEADHWLRVLESSGESPAPGQGPGAGGPQAPPDRPESPRDAGGPADHGSPPHA